MVDSSFLLLLGCLVQVVHLFYCYLHVDPQATRPAVLAVPTGAAGHVAAALIAQQMGLPLGSLLACTNENDFLPRLLDSGLATRGDVVSTCSPAMDIQVTTNPTNGWLGESRRGQTIYASVIYLFIYCSRRMICYSLRPKWADCLMFRSMPYSSMRNFIYF